MSEYELVSDHMPVVAAFTVPMPTQDAADQSAEGAPLLPRSPQPRVNFARLSSTLAEVANARVSM